MPRTRFAFVFAAALLLVTVAAHAQTLTNVLNYDFPSGGATGANPYGNLIQASDGNLYGTFLSGGANNSPTSNYGGGIFKIVPSTGALSVIYSCNATGSDCAGPDGLIELSDGNLYGTANYGCAGGYGCIFRIGLDGSNYTDLHDFPAAEDYPNGFPIYTPNGSLSGDGEIIGCNSGDGGQTAGSYGYCWQFSPDLGSGITVFTGLIEFSTTAANGYQPVAGVSIINGNFYTTSQLGGTDGNGVLFYTNGDTISVLENFTLQGTNGSFPSVTPKLYSDGNIYGTSLSNYPAGYTNNGAVWKSGLTSGFTTLYDFNTAVGNSPIDPVTFDTAGNILFIAEGDRQDASTTAGQTNFGELYLEPHAGGTVKTLYTFTQDSNEGDTPLGQPFFDNRGHLWTIQLTGGGNEIGSIDEWTLSTETKAPISLALSASTVAPSTPVTLSWSTNNSFSDNEKYCFGSGSANETNTSWNQQQTGTYSDGVLSGSVSGISFAATGTYTFAITCGGVESALAVLTVTNGPLPTTTALTASPNPVAAGAAITLTATVAKTSGTGTPTGNVTFSVGTTTLATVALTNGVAKLTAPTTSYPDGTYPVVATYNGDSGDSPSSSSKVNVIIAPKTTSALTASPTSGPVGTTFTLTDTVTATTGTATGNVEFYDGTTLLATVALSGGKAIVKAPSSSYPAGTYVIHAVYAGNTTGAGSTSNNVTITLTK